MAYIEAYKKYSENYDFNIERFFSVDTSCECCEECPAKKGSEKWKMLPQKLKGVNVDTNWKEEQDLLDLEHVYICESPSEKEMAYSIPAVGMTGIKIYKKIFETKEIKDFWCEELDKKVYRTNIVRCQADGGIKGYTEQKNKRVKEAWEFCKEHLWKELDKLILKIKNCNKNITFYITPGQDFEAIAKEIETYLVDKGINCTIENHPSKTK